MNKAKRSRTRRAGPPSEQAPNTAKLLAHALAAMGDERWDEAIATLQRFLEVENGSENRLGAYLNLCACYLELERFDDALSALDQVEHLSPNDPDTLRSRGVVYACAARISEAIDAFETYTRRAPDQARCYETRNALRHLNEIQRGKVPIGDYLLGHLQEQISHNMELGDWQIIEHKAKRMIAANPGRSEGHFALGVACAEQERYQEALDALLVADAHDPNYQPTLYNIAHAYLRLDQPAQALEWGERARRSEPNHVATLYLLGLSCEKQARREDAITWWQRALKIDPSYELPQTELHRVGAGSKPTEPPLSQNAQEMRRMSPVVKARMTRRKVYRVGGVTLTFDSQVGYVLEDAENPLNGTVHAGSPFRTGHISDQEVLDLIGVIKLLLLNQINIENTRDVAVLVYYANRPTFNYQARFDGGERTSFQTNNRFVVTEVPRFFKLRIDSDLATPYGNPMHGKLIYLNQSPQPGILINTLGLEFGRSMPGLENSVRPASPFGKGGNDVQTKSA